MPCVAFVCLSWGEFHAIRSRGDARRIRGPCADSGAGQRTRHAAAGDVTDNDAAGNHRSRSNRIPGIWTYTIPSGQLHPTGQPVSIRGFGSSTTINTLVMLDGVPINDPYFRTIDWSARSRRTTIERVEVIRGGGATSLWIDFCGV